MGCVIPHQSNAVNISHQTNAGLNNTVMPKFKTLMPPLTQLQQGVSELLKKQERQCSCNQRCSGKEIGITYSECMSVALVIQHVMRVRHTAICGHSGSTVFSHIIS